MRRREIFWALGIAALALGTAEGAVPTRPAPESAQEIAKRLVSLPYYVPDPRVRNAADERTPLLEQLRERGQQGAEVMVTYLVSMPGSADDPQGKMNRHRQQLIRDISSLGEPAIKPLSDALLKPLTPLQQRELTQALGGIKTPAATKALMPLLQSKGDGTRAQAVQGLIGRMSMKLAEVGSDDVVMALIEHAAVEPDASARGYICKSMSRLVKPVLDGRPGTAKQLEAAAEMLRERLKNDASADVRLAAACVLTEFGDHSGFGELKKAALALQASGDTASLWGMENLVPALERASGQTFGAVPMNPMLSSSTITSAKLQADRRALIDKMAEWVKANPDAQAVPNTQPKPVEVNPQK